MFLLALIALSVNAVWLDQLTVEYETNPFGVLSATPRFTWVVQPEDDGSTVRGSSQSAYQIQVGTSSTSFSANIWDSGKKSGVNQNVLVSYGGSQLSSDTRYYWRVSVWDQNDKQSTWSSIAQFHTGIAKSEFQGGWIQGAQNYWHQLRKEFSIDSSSVAQATAFVSGVGYFELYLNGRRVGNHQLDPAWTTYNKNILYVTYDVTSMLSASNAVGLLLGRGWWGMLGLGESQGLLQLNIKYKNGTTQSVVTDTTWKSYPGPITYDDIYNGETYAAYLETPGWTNAGFDDSRWLAAVMGSIGKASSMSPGLDSQIMPPVREVVELKPRLMTEPQQGVYVFDFDQNFSGWIRLNIDRHVPNGTRVQLRHAELLNHDGSGNIYTGNLRGAKATDVYYAKGSPDGEMYTPRFTYHGFRFVELTGLPFVPTLDTITGVHIYSSVKQIASLSFSHPILSHLQQNILWGQQSNLMGIPTDCDQRDERRGWTGDAALSAEEASFNFQMGSFYTNWLKRIRDEQGSDGTLTDTVPFYNFGSRPADPNWGTVYPTIVWTLMRLYGDVDVIRDHWTTLKSYLNFLAQAVASTGLKNMYYNYGDWVPPPPAPMVDSHYSSSFAYLHDVLLMIDMAQAAGYSSDVTYYQALFANLTTQYNAAWYDSTKKCYADCGQSAQSFALWLGVVPQADVQAVLNLLVNDIVVTHNTHLTTGILGTKFMMEVLSKYGRHDVAIAVATQTSYPSWGYMMAPTDAETPATTLWELWDSDVEGDGMNSRNHIMFGSVSGWFHRTFAGLWHDNTAAGFSRIIIKPMIYGTNMPVTFFDDSIQSIRGPVSVSWDLDPVGSTCGSVPENSQLTLSCPSGPIQKVIFASFGTPQGSCPNFNKGSCDDVNTTSLVTQACVGQTSCVIPATNDFFGGDPCYGTAKTLAVAIGCQASGTILLELTVNIPFTSTAQVFVPTVGSPTNSITIFEGGNAVWQNAAYVSGTSGITSGTADSSGAYVVFQVGSGSYFFTVTGS